MAAPTEDELEDFIKDHPRKLDVGQQPATPITFNLYTSPTSVDVRLFSLWEIPTVEVRVH